MDQTKFEQHLGIVVIRKSIVPMLLRLVLFEVIAGVTYLLLRFLYAKYLQVLLSSSDVDMVTVMLSAGFTLLEVIIACYVLLQWATNYYILRPKEIMYISGVFQRKERSYTLANVQSVSLDQDIFSRILKYGNVKIFSPAFKQDIYLYEVPEPHEVIKDIKQASQSDSGAMGFILRR